MPSPSRAKKAQSQNGTPGTMANPYKRKEGTDVVRLTARVSKDCLIAYKQHSLTLKSDDGIEVNRWLEALIWHGIKYKFMGGKGE